MRHLRNLVPALLWLAGAGPARPQMQAELKQIVERLDQLARENQALREEIQALRQEVQALRTQPPAAERLEIQERRIDEQAQTKVETSQRFPLRVAGMVLFNAFLNGPYNGGEDNPVQTSRTAGPRLGGATFRQSIIGLEYDGPATLGQGKVRGSLYMDFFSGSSSVLNHQFRIRTASIGIDWRTRSLVVGLEKPVFNPREANSLAQVGVLPLTGSGNLWVWQPQVRFEQRFQVAEGTRFDARLGLVQVADLPLNLPEYRAEAGFRRPAIQGRLNLVHEIDERRRVEFAPGFHASTSKFGPVSVGSRLFSLDWLFTPWSRLEFTGAYYYGRNVGMFGAPFQGIIELPHEIYRPVHSHGGWGQLSFPATDRLTFNVFAGQHDDRDRDLLAGNIGRNRTWAANAMYLLAPNVRVALEALQLRTNFVAGRGRLNNRYDLAVAYLF